MVQSILRQIVAGPRARHAEADLDLCYVTDFLVATSGPSATYPSLAYRNPLEDLVGFLDKKHGSHWAIWEFRAEGTGYPDEAVYGRIWHWPWPDHHPPPFGLMPGIIGGMREWLHPANEEEGANKRVAVVHCKAGKGRSGTVSVSYLMCEEGWSKEDALKQFTQRRMRPGFGAGISIPSQLRWIDYVERWNHGKKLYVERTVEVTEVHVWGLRQGVKIAVEGYADNGKWIKTFHVFTKEERDDHESTISTAAVERSGTLVDTVTDVMRRSRLGRKAGFQKSSSKSPARGEDDGTEPTRLDSDVDDSKLRVDAVESRTSGASTPKSTASSTSGLSKPNDSETVLDNVIFRPSSRIILPTSDVNLAVERRKQSRYGWSVVTAVAHVWFNCYFEGNGPENYVSEGQSTSPDGSGVFTIAWDAMDGIKGSSRKGTRGFDKVSVVWREVPSSDPSGLGRDAKVVSEPAKGEPVPGGVAADWRTGSIVEEEGIARELGAEKESSEHESSSQQDQPDEDSPTEDGEEGIERGLRLPDDSQPAAESTSTGNVPGDELRDRKEHPLGDIKRTRSTDITSS